MKPSDQDEEIQSRASASTSSRGKTSRQNQSLSPEVMEILVPSLKVGAVAGMLLALLSCTPVCS
jgi:hypothetical protein